MSENHLVGFPAASSSFSIVDATILVDKEDYPGIHHAARDLATNFGRVTRRESNTVSFITSNRLDGEHCSKHVIIVGSVQSSALLRHLVESGLVKFDDIDSKWEPFMTVTVSHPSTWVENALMIAGSPKRGAIYGIYTLSEQIGVLPWYWWADAQPKYHTEIYANPLKKVQGEPNVRYRGIFINDEAPALTGWVLGKFGSYGTAFYTRVFELLLRLRIGCPHNRLKAYPPINICRQMSHGRQYGLAGQLLEPFSLRMTMERSPHVLCVRFEHSNIVLEKVILDLGGLSCSYLGPPPSFHVQK